MKTIKMLTISFLLVVMGAAPGWAAKGKAEANGKIRQAIQRHTGMSSAVKQYASKVLLPITENKIFLKSTTEQNAQGVSLAEIKKIDGEWKAAEEEMPIQTEKLTNTCAKEMIRIVSANSQIIEAFVMDNQGAVVCENALTSDYWQGDEAKWQNSFNGGKGGVDVGAVEFDKSANAKLQQISLPIYDASGRAIGAITFGVNVGSL